MKDRLLKLFRKVKYAREYYLKVLNLNFIKEKETVETMKVFIQQYNKLLNSKKSLEEELKKLL